MRVERQDSPGVQF